MTPCITVKNDLARPGAMLCDDLIIDFAFNLDKNFQTWRFLPHPQCCFFAILVSRRQRGTGKNISELFELNNDIL